jgi:hypothetical protein
VPDTARYRTTISLCVRHVRMPLVDRCRQTAAHTAAAGYIARSSPRCIAASTFVREPCVVRCLCATASRTVSRHVRAHSAFGMRSLPLGSQCTQACLQKRQLRLYHDGDRLGVREDPQTIHNLHTRQSIHLHRRCRSPAGRIAKSAVATVAFANGRAAQCGTAPA